MKKSIALLLGLLATSVIVACGGSDSNSGSGNCTGPDGSSASAECLSCVKDSCGSEYSAFCSGNCGANAATSSCQQAAEDIGTCVLSHCSSECDTGGNTAGSSNGGGSSDGGSSNTAGGAHNSGGSSGAGTPTTANCVKLEECCGTLPGEQLQGPCYQSAGYNNDGPCLNLLNAYQNAGQCTATSGNATAACTVDAQCIKETLPKTAVDTFKSGCTMSNGTVSDDCPADAVVGCCTVSVVETCFYDAESAISEADCKMAGGTYSATP